MDRIKALTFDTGGTLLDWHSGFRAALARAGARHGVSRDWSALTNELRRRSLGAMLNLGEHGPPEYNFDDAHRSALDALLADEGLEMFDDSDRHDIAWTAPHSFAAWPDCADGLARIRERRIAASFTILSVRLVVDSSRANGLTWDALLSCETFGVYKLLPDAYKRAAELLQLEPHECCMVACHGFDLDAARAVGFRTALVRRPDEWGGAEPLTGPAPKPGTHDIEVDDFHALAEALP